MMPLTSVNFCIIQKESLDQSDVCLNCKDPVFEQQMQAKSLEL